MYSILALGYIFAAFGLAFIVGHSKITDGLRGLFFQMTEDALVFSKKRHVRIVALLARWALALVECPGCIGFWIGVGTGLYMQQTFGVAVTLGVMTSGTNTFLALFSGLVKRE